VFLVISVVLAARAVVRREGAVRTCLLTVGFVSSGALRSWRSKVVAVTALSLSILIGLAPLTLAVH